MTREELYDGDVVLHVGDCLDVMRVIPDASIDAVVTDPPYDLTSGKPGGSGAASVNPDSPAGRSMIGTSGFMGQHWDSTGIAFKVEVWAECLRVLKPGGHLLAFGGTRTYHRMAVAVEDAEFELRDSITWLYGQGFPKSLDVAKSIDARLGVERDPASDQQAGPVGVFAHAGDGTPQDPTVYAEAYRRTVATSPEAHEWDGWGTALKPAAEPIVVARKPLAGTVADNVLRHRVGALNIDGCRTSMGEADRAETEAKNRHADFGSGPRENRVYGSDERARGEDGNYDGTAGRWPSNVVLTHSPACRPGGVRTVRTDTHYPAARPGGGIGNDGHSGQAELDERTPGAEVVEAWECAPGCPVGQLGDDARFFPTFSPDWQGDPCAGCDGSGIARMTPADGVPRYVCCPACNGHGREPSDRPIFRYHPKAGTGERPRADEFVHPTVKPLGLMRWLVKLVTPPGGVVLDLFAGSGTTGEAALREGMRAVLIEREPKYAELVRTRLAKPQQAALL